MEILVDNALIGARWRRLGREHLYALTVNGQLDLMLFPRTLHMLVPVAGQAKLDLLIGIQRKDVMNHRSAAGPEGKLVEMLFLGEIRRKLDGIAARSAHGAPDRQPADLLRRRKIPLEQS